MVHDGSGPVHPANHGDDLTAIHGQHGKHGDDVLIHLIRIGTDREDRHLVRHGVRILDIGQLGVAGVGEGDGVGDFVSHIDGSVRGIDDVIGQRYDFLRAHPSTDPCTAHCDVCGLIAVLIGCI